MHVVKWPSILLKSWGVNTARFLKYVSPFYNIMHERVKSYLCRMSLNVKDTHWEKATSNKRQALAKIMNMNIWLDIWAVVTSKQLFIRAGSYTEIIKKKIIIMKY